MKQSAPRARYAIIAVLTLGGCANGLLHGGDESPPASMPEVPSWSGVAEITELASFANTLTMLSPESQAQELERAEQDYARTGGSIERLRLALLLTLGQGELQDLERARGLLAEADPATVHPAYAGLGELLASVVAVRLAEQRNSSEKLAAERAYSEELAEERARSEALRKQLEELKDIERQMNERAKRTPLPMQDDD